VPQRRNERLPQDVSASFNNYQQSCGIAIRIAAMVEIRVDIDPLHAPGAAPAGRMGTYSRRREAELRLSRQPIKAIVNFRSFRSFRSLRMIESDGIMAARGGQS
jgi:hypothetical protein